jgi:hypothetical protein
MNNFIIKFIGLGIALVGGAFMLGSMLFILNGDFIPLLACIVMVVLGFKMFFYDE